MMAWLGLAAMLSAQAAPDQKRVDEAIARGAQYLKGAGVRNDSDKNPVGGYPETRELVLYTLVHAGVPERDPDFQELLKQVLSARLEHTYQVSLQAMILEEIERVRYQPRIAGCAQFLVDAQCQNGQWTYNGTTTLDVPTPSLPKDVASGGGVKEYETPVQRTKPKVTRKLTVRKTRDGPDSGDNSNSQYAALGLRACHDSGIVFPKDVLMKARQWWRASQHEDEKDAAGKPPAVASGAGPSVPPAGWCYGGKAHGHNAYGSMTAGAAGSLAIYGYMLDDKNWKKDAFMLRGLEWMGRHFSVTANEGPSEHVKEPGWMLYYTLYALERAGVLCDTESLGGHRWYPEGAEVILAAQKPDGSWLGPNPHGDRSVVTNTVWDTCFAILFLKRATRPLVASVDSK
jgi:hypothetical protein